MSQWLIVYRSLGDSPTKTVLRRDIPNLPDQVKGRTVRVCGRAFFKRQVTDKGGSELPDLDVCVVKRLSRSHFEIYGIQGD